MKQIILLVDPMALPKFTTLLQGGIYLNATQGETIGALLTSLPGFTEEYLREKVQTIFLNGLPVDHLQQQLWGTEAVLAISAAMPGLAGAIFRKDGVHAVLRTKPTEKLSDADSTDMPITIRLKLFNMIAAEQGERILTDGCVIQASLLQKFFVYRPPVLAGIQKIMVNETVIDSLQLETELQPDAMLHLTVKGNYDN